MGFAFFHSQAHWRLSAIQRPAGLSAYHYQCKGPDIPFQLLKQCCASRLRSLHQRYELACKIEINGWDFFIAFVTFPPLPLTSSQRPVSSFKVGKAVSNSLETCNIKNRDTVVGVTGGDFHDVSQGMKSR